MTLCQEKGNSCSSELVGSKFETPRITHSKTRPVLFEPTAMTPYGRNVE